METSKIGSIFDERAKWRKVVKMALPTEARTRVTKPLKTNKVT